NREIAAVETFRNAKRDSDETNCEFLTRLQYLGLDRDNAPNEPEIIEQCIKGLKKFPDVVKDILKAKPATLVLLRPILKVQDEIEKNASEDVSDMYARLAKKSSKKSSPKKDSTPSSSKSDKKSSSKDKKKKKKVHATEVKFKEEKSESSSSESESDSDDEN